MFQPINTAANLIISFQLSLVPLQQSNIEYQPTVKYDYTTNRVLTNDDYVDPTTLENLVQELLKQQD